jgi:ParB-like chromosome segregation protein Spo0J
LPPLGFEMSEPAKSAQSASPPLQVQYWPVDRLIPSPRNARTHNPAQIAEIAGSIRAFGFTNPILVGEHGDVVAGHGRLAAARQLGLVEVPVIPLVGLTELQRRQLILADNRIALNSGWDLEMLSLELKDLSGLGVDLSSLGFSARDLQTRYRRGSAEASPMKTRSLNSAMLPSPVLAISGVLVRIG